MSYLLPLEVACDVISTPIRICLFVKAKVACDVISTPIRICLFDRKKNK
jgi:hypothetical protein